MTDASTPQPDPTQSPDLGQGPDQEIVLTALKAVKDPEIGVNIVDLGLVYTVATREGEIDVEMTLTSPACPAGPQIVREATEVIESLQGVSKANVKLVMSPPWSPDRMSEDARDELGMY
ncbi:metal-sulfur cluster assembly factor [Tautonia rosea]|uniref:metal-sulfur cluster assembly factor n=1 Tax=Tautonia rosea TaxID=2728037 RepID=UPI00147283A4|nr:metal-sulfur cluster assembly factor [Tautonia rosea]